MLRRPRPHLVPKAPDFFFCSIRWGVEFRFYPFYVYPKCSEFMGNPTMYGNMKSFLTNRILILVQAQCVRYNRRHLQTNKQTFRDGRAVVRYFAGHETVPVFFPPFSNDKRRSRLAANGLPLTHNCLRFAHKRLLCHVFQQWPNWTHGSLYPALFVSDQRVARCLHTALPSSTAWSPVSTPALTACKHLLL